MKKNYNFFYCMLAIFSLSAIQFFWIVSTVKWTLPIMYFLSFTIFVWLFLVFFYRWYRKWSALWLTVLGVGVGFSASTFAWAFADLIYSPERIEKFIAESSVLFLFKEAIFVSLVTGGTIVAVLEIWMPRFLMRATK